MNYAFMATHEKEFSVKRMCQVLAPSEADIMPGEIDHSAREQSHPKNYLNIFAQPLISAEKCMAAHEFGDYSFVANVNPPALELMAV